MVTTLNDEEGFEVVAETASKGMDKYKHIHHWI